MSVVELKKDAEAAGDAPFSIGDVVHLRSGGVHVTVRRCTAKARVWTVTVDWMDEANTLCSAEFDARQLQSPVEKESSSDDG